MKKSRFSEAQIIGVLKEGEADENRRLKHVVADLTLDNQALKAVIGKNGDLPGAA